MSNNLWWEKTVEYLYVREYLGPYKFLAPLDGNHEKVSDSMLANGIQWIIVEFKKDLNWEGPEKNKFNKHEHNRYDKAKDELMPNYGDEFGIKHHFIVYGYVDDKSDLKLKVEKYFSVPGKKTYPPIDLFKGGARFLSFKKYVDRFIELKSGNGGGGGKGGSNDDNPPSDPGPNGGLTISDFQTVFGISEKEGVVRCMTMEQFRVEASKAIWKSSRRYNRGAIVIPKVYLNQDFIWLGESKIKSEIPEKM